MLYATLVTENDSGITGSGARDTLGAETPRNGMWQRPCHGWTAHGKPTQVTKHPDNYFAVTLSYISFSNTVTKYTTLLQFSLVSSVYLFQSFLISNKPCYLTITSTSFSSPVPGSEPELKQSAASYRAYSNHTQVCWGWEKPCVWVIGEINVLVGNVCKFWCLSKWDKWFVE